MPLTIDETQSSDLQEYRIWVRPRPVYGCAVNEVIIDLDLIVKLIESNGQVVVRQIERYISPAQTIGSQK